MKDADQQARLRRFWGAAIFSLGVLWGISNIVYCPIAALTSIVGSSWFEVAIILAGGLLTFLASTLAFFDRRMASIFLLSCGFILLALALCGQLLLRTATHGVINLLLLFLSGAVALSLGIFGATIDRKRWPTLRDLP
ncbi:MAG: hypothetical protein ACYDBH_02415 [Acidobacteriaceae bacterium]